MMPIEFADKPARAILPDHRNSSIETHIIRWLQAETAN